MCGQRFTFTPEVGLIMGHHATEAAYLGCARRIRGKAMGEDPLENMQARAQQCRRLADFTHDREMAERLRGWAKEIEEDIERLRGKLPRE